MEKVKKFASFVFGFPLTIISLAFIANFIYSNRLEVAPYITHFDVLPAVVGLLFICLFFLFRSLVWREMLSLEGFHPSTAESTYLLASSELKRYIPGSVMAIIARLKSFSGLKIPKRTIVRMIFYESALFVITSILIALPGISYMFSKVFIDPKILYLTPLFLLIALVFLLLFMEKKVTSIVHSLPGFFNAFLLMLIAWIFFAIGNFLILSAFYYISPVNIVYTSSLFVLSWLIGYAIIIAPLGLGAREAFLTYALSFSMPIGIAAALAIIARIAFTVAELVFLGISYVVHMHVKLKFKISTYTLILWSIIISYISYFTYVSFEKYNNFFMGRFDLGNMDQTVWNTLHGNFFQISNPDSTNTVSRLAFHSDFILVLFAPFYIIWEDPRMLLLIQTVVLASGAFFVYGIAQKILNYKYISLIFAVSYLLNPFVQKQNLFDFHSVTLATTFLLGAFYFILKNKYKWMFLMLLLASITKEQVFAISAVVLIFVFLKTRDKRFAIASIVSFVLFYLLVSVIIPHARGGEHFATEYFQSFGDNPSEIMINIVLNPVNTASKFLTRENFDYLFKLFLPTGFTVIFAPLFLIFAIPDLLVNLLSNNTNFRSLTFHYAATIIPFIYISSIKGVKKIVALKIKLINLKTVANFMLLSAFTSAYIYGTLPGARRPTLEIYTRTLEYRQQIDEFLSLIPKNLSVTASNNIGSHMSQRERIYTLPVGLTEADVVLVLLNDEYARPTLSDQKQMVLDLKQDPEYIQVFEIGNFVAFSKRSAAKYIRRSREFNAF